MGLYVGTQFGGEDNFAASQRYLATSNSGEAVNQGMIILVVGVVIGLLVKIAKKNT